MKIQTIERNAEIRKEYQQLKSEGKKKFEALKIIANKHFMSESNVSTILFTKRLMKREHNFAQLKKTVKNDILMIQHDDKVIVKVNDKTFAEIKQKDDSFYIKYLYSKHSAYYSPSFDDALLRVFNRINFISNKRQKKGNNDLSEMQRLSGRCA